jgi:hypothetical protein
MTIIRSLSRRNPDTVHLHPNIIDRRTAGRTKLEGVGIMSRFKALLIAAPVAVGLLAAPAAHADWHGRGGGWHGGGGGWHHGGGGDAAAAAIIGLGAAAIIGGVLASQAYAPPPVYSAPPPAYYPPPGYYAPAPGYYSPGY